MRVVLITHELSRTDGQGRVNLFLARHLLSRGHTVHAITRSIDPALHGMERFSATLLPVPKRPYVLEGPLFMLFAAFALRRAARDAIRVNNGTASLGWAQVNYCHYCHSTYFRMPRIAANTLASRLRWGYQRACTGFNALAEQLVYHRRSGTIIAISARIRDDLVHDAHADPRRIRVVLDGVDTDEFRPAADEAERAALRSGLGLPVGPLALFAGDLRSPRKGLGILLRAIAHVPEAMTLLVAGDAKASPFVEEARLLGLAERVIFLGFRRDMPLLMRCVDLFIFPAFYEPFSLVVLEAMASGLPVITSKVTGASELINSGVNGVVLEEPGGAPALVEAIRHILSDPEHGQALGAAARNTALDYSWERVMSRVEVILGACVP